MVSSFLFFFLILFEIMLKRINIATNNGIYRKYLLSEPAREKAIMENKREIENMKVVEREGPKRDGRKMTVLLLAEKREGKNRR